MWLDEATFRTVVDATPLISIDLVVESRDGEILVGRRLNRPAQGFWFVPGGRIQKNETLDAAFTRLTSTELGISLSRPDARLLGVYEHFYDDSVFGPAESGPSTHYGVFGYHLKLDPEQYARLPVQQHSEYCWKTAAEIEQAPQVHENSRAYMNALAPSNEVDITP